MWSNRQMRSYLGMTAHCIIDWKMHSFMLACKRFTGRHTADNILQEYEEISFYNIPDKVSDIVTDNASNMMCTFSLPGFTDGSSEELQMHLTMRILTTLLTTD